MTIPMWVLLAFAGWTIVTLLGGVGVARWSQILTGRKQLNEFPADVPHGSARYRRAMRAHANCVENLPVYGAVAVVVSAAGIHSPTVDTLAIAYLAARVLQTLTHILFEETNTAVFVRFSFFFTQLVCVVTIGVLASLHAAGRL